MINNNGNYMYLIRWYGPFYSRQDLEDWEREQESLFYLYLFQGKRKNKKTYNYYCGMTYDRSNSVSCVYNRMKDSNHHIHVFEQERKESLLIWVGTIANNVHPTRKDISICENMITSEIAQIELDESIIVNKTNKLPPTRNVYLINEWYNRNQIKYRPQSIDFIPNIVPDVITYDAASKNLYRAKKLVFISKMIS